MESCGMGNVESSRKNEGNAWGPGATDLDKDFFCPLCCQVLKDVFSTACGHNFCFMCIMFHLKKKSTCPCCDVDLDSSHLYPNMVLNKVLQNSSILKTLRRSDSFLQCLLLKESLVPQVLNDLIVCLSEERVKIEKKDVENNMASLHGILDQVRHRKRNELSKLNDEIQGLKDDVKLLEKEKLQLLELKKRHLSKSDGCSLSSASSSITTCSRRIVESTLQESRKRKRVFENEYQVLSDCYTQMRSRQAENDKTHNLGKFRLDFSGFIRYSQLRVVEELPCEKYYPSDIVSSLEFDRDDEFFATACVSRCIKVFKLKAKTNILRPVVQISTNSRPSCLSWNPHVKHLTACSDYDGIVSIWDVNTKQIVAGYKEHAKRVWSVDFCQSEPSRLVSGSDDGKVKIWSNKDDGRSILTIDVKFNVCSVKYNPSSSNFVAIGSADHRIYYYDLRLPKIPLHTFEGHQRAVSYVKFLSGEKMVSASTDSTLRLWDLQKNRLVDVFRGHTNEKNFVGLSVSGGYIACGSETNEVFVYHEGILTPAIRHIFPDPDPDASSNPFVSAVCWKKNRSILVAANSHGTVRVLELTP